MRPGTVAATGVVVCRALVIVAMTPDLASRAGVPHYRWTDVVLGHVDSHYVPGGHRTWSVLAYLAVLACTGPLIVASRRAP